jgi:hypothetical protein
VNALRHRPLTLLRTALFALLALGVMLRPMAMELCEAFTKDHQAPAHAHAHHHEHDHHPAEDAAGDSASEDWHVHGEQAQADAGGGAADLVLPVVFKPIHYGAAPAPTLHVASVPSVHAIAPFRPPIV